MAKKILKFGKLKGWNALKINLFGRDVEGVTELEYEDTLAITNEFGAGGFPIGQAEGNYEAKASITLYAEELDAIQASVPEGVRIQQIPPFDIVVLFEESGVISKDVIRNCRMIKNQRSFKNNEGKSVTKIDLLVSHIDWNA